MELIFLAIGTGIIAGSYPAFYLSAFRAVSVIKGSVRGAFSAVGLRKGLVVFQFVVSIVLILGVLAIYSELRFLRDKDLGFQPRQRLVLTFPTESAMNEGATVMQDLRGLA